MFIFSDGVVDVAVVVVVVVLVVVVSNLAVVGDVDGVAVIVSEKYDHHFLPTLQKPGKMTLDAFFIPLLSSSFDCFSFERKFSLYLLDSIGGCQLPKPYVCELIIELLPK